MKIVQKLLNFVFPPKCLHCHVSIEEHRWLCVSCSELIDILAPEGRCFTCFQVKGERHSCNQGSPFYLQAAVCDYAGPAATLVKKMKYGGMPFLANSIAAFLVVQWIKLGWETPDYIMPAPISKMRRYERGYNQAALLAEAMSSHLKIPVLDILRRRSGDYSQAGLSLEHRTQLNAESFYLKKMPGTKLLELLGDKKILLVDDVMTTGTTLRICGDLLQSYAPQALYALTFCLTQKD